MLLEEIGSDWVPISAIGVVFVENLNLLLLFCEIGNNGVKYKYFDI